MIFTGEINQRERIRESSSRTQCFSRRPGVVTTPRNSCSAAISGGSGRGPLGSTHQLRGTVVAPTSCEGQLIGVEAPTSCCEGQLGRVIGVIAPTSCEEQLGSRGDRDSTHQLRGTIPMRTNKRFGQSLKKQNRSSTFNLQSPL